MISEDKGGPLRSKKYATERINWRKIAVIAGIVAAIAVGAVLVFIMINGENDDGDACTVSYYSNGMKISEKTVAAGTTISIADDAGGSGDHERFVGWNTRSDMKGSILLPGASLRMEVNISLYAMYADLGSYAIILPEKQVGYTITADPMLVKGGGSSIISFTLLPSHIDENLIISVNGNPMKLDAMKRIHLTDIKEDKIVTVTGVYDKREHSITLPSVQRGYVLTSSEDKVHHGESYVLEYKLLPGYREAFDFGIHVNGGNAKLPSGGSLLIENVSDNHEITVTGVEPIPYNIACGKNISALVNGKSASTSTVEDIVTIQPGGGYSIPETFNSNIKGAFTAEGKGYRIHGDVFFPSVLKITAGDNVRMNNGSQKAIFVCPDDKIKISPSSGYDLPNNYVDKVRGLSGVKYSADSFSFSDDTILPSIYKVVFNGYSKVHATFFIVGGDNCSIPASNPSRDHYLFEKWQSISTIVLTDLSINAVWIPKEYNVVFGNNLVFSINGIFYSKPGSYRVNIEQFVTISAFPGYELPAGYLPSKVFVKNGTGYNIASDYVLPDIYCVYYVDVITNLSKKYFFSDSEIHMIINPATQANPLFVFDLEGTEYGIEDFEGWVCDGQIYKGGSITVDRDLMFYSSWRSE